ncbi:MAG: hypothetical protein B6A08_10405 [Sorangiineae bacterium NIC37A_2]|nr:MAG: hypothetical protein B6A08_10405 [Sorangiineae bacterium NIC37A_2]
MSETPAESEARPTLSWDELGPVGEGVLMLASLLGPFEGNAAAGRAMAEWSRALEGTRKLSKTTLINEYRSLRDRGWLRPVGTHGSRVVPVAAHFALERVPMPVLHELLGSLERGRGIFEKAHLVPLAALYAGNHRAFETAVRYVESPRAKEALYLEVLELHEISQRIRLLPERHRPEATLIAFTAASENLAPGRDEWRELLLALPPSADRSRALLSLGTLDALASDRIAAEKLRLELGPDLSHLLGAALAFADFRVEDARSELIMATAASRGPKGNKKAKLEGLLVDIFYALLATGDAAHKRAAIELEGTVSKRRNSAADVARALAAWAAQQPVEVWREDAPPGLFGQACLAFLILWGSEAGILEMRAQSVTAIVDIASLAGRRGYGALEQILVRGVDALGTKTPSWLMASVQRSEPWEVALQELEGLATRTEGKRQEVDEQGGGEQLYWKIEELRGGYAEVSPRLRKTSKKGEQKGRAVALKRLASLDRSIIDEHDVPAIGCVRASPGFYGSEYFLSEKIVLALVGHPRVLDEKDRPLRVVGKSLELSVESGPSGYRIRAEPRDCHRAGPFAVRSGGELRVYSISEEDLSLLKRFADPKVVFPETARERLGGLLARLAGTLEVHSELDEGEVTEVGDARPTVVLDREHPGLRVTMGVRPLGPSGPLLVPGVGASVVRHGALGETLRVRRDLEQEKRLLGEVLERSPILASFGIVGEAEKLSDLDQCYELILSLTELGEALRVEWREGSPLKVPTSVRAEMVKVHIGASPDWLSATLNIEPSPGELILMQELLSSFAETKGRFIELSNGEVLALSADLRTKLETIAAAGVQEKSGALGFHPLAAPALEALTSDFLLEDSEGVLARLAARVGQGTDGVVRVPRSLQAELRDYQRAGFRWMKQLLDAGGGAILADDMGLGKTLQILAVLLTMRAEGPALIIAPKSLLGHWATQAETFAPSLKTRVFASDEGELDKSSLRAGELLIASYGLVQRHVERLKTVEFRAIVLDEAQAIKNAESLRAKAVHSLRAESRIVATGTPIENHLGELWSLMHFANPGLLGTREAFERRFTDRIRLGDRAATAALRKLVAPFVLRRTKAEVLSELPEKTEVTLTVEPSASELAFYEALRRKAVGDVEQGGTPGVRRMRLLAALTRLRQAACHPSLAGGPAELPSSKHETLFALLDDLREGAHRTLIFSQFVEHLKLVRAGLEARGVTFEFLDGSKSTRAREESVRRFQDGEAEVFLISLRAGGFGLNLTAADYVIHLDPWWNPAVEAQATDRAHRIGQRRPVTVYRLVTKGTVEERILSLHGEKRATAELLLDGTDKATPLDLDVLRGLLL